MALDGLRTRVLRFLRVSGRPDPPPGSDDSLETFRASPRFLYRLGIDWLFKQIGAAFGILVSFAFLRGWQIPFLSDEAEEAIDGFWERLEEVEIGLGPIFLELPLADLISLFEIFAALIFLIQLVLSGLLLRLSWEMRWYMVSDESLRLREGLVFVKEQTMTVANIQNMKVKQGPIQKLFGYADLEVRTAGGGGSAESDEASGGSDDFHVGRFRGLDNAREVRDRLRAVLSKHRDSGLGDPDDAVAAVPPPVPGDVPIQASGESLDSSPSGALEAAARNVLAQARALRQVVDQAASVRSTGS